MHHLHPPTKRRDRRKTATIRHSFADHCGPIWSLKNSPVEAKDAKEICRAESLLDKLASLKFDAERITQKAEIKDDLKTALSGIREQSRIIEILAKMQGQIQQPKIDLTVNNFALLKIHDRLSRKLEE
jgi:hypothetical protein